MHAYYFVDFLIIQAGLSCGGGEVRDFHCEMIHVCRLYTIGIYL